MELRLDNNSIEGVIPSEVGNTPNLGKCILWLLFAWSTRWHWCIGRLPLCFHDVVSFYLRQNSLSGTIPTELGHLAALGKCLLPSRSMHVAAVYLMFHIVWLSNIRSSLVGWKQLDGHDFYGAWPLSRTRWVTLPLVYYMTSRSCTPTKIKGCQPYVEVLAVSNNALSGTFPTLSNLGKSCHL